jgi:stearoyl-CoA desaturase (delta-9 desaturase)
MRSRSSLIARAVQSAAAWVDNEAAARQLEGKPRTGVDYQRLVPFIILHGGCLGIIWVGWSWFAVAAAIGLYMLRAFFVTAFYHRYLSHKAYATSRPAQFVFALLGNTAAQRGPLWWAAHHRQHHGKADKEGDPHSPHAHSLYWSHMGWITARENFTTKLRLVPDLARYPELRFLDRFDGLVPIAFAAGLFGLGSALKAWAPGLGTSGPQLLVWGFFVSTVILFHVTCMVNSVAHLFGTRRYETRDQSRNNLLVALLAMGEGWHNNHHHYPNSARNGFRWWEVDVTWYALKAMSWLGIVWDLKPVPRHALAAVTEGPAR